MFWDQRTPVFCTHRKKSKADHNWRGQPLQSAWRYKIHCFFYESPSCFANQIKVRTIIVKVVTWIYQSCFMLFLLFLAISAASGCKIPASANLLILWGVFSNTSLLSAVYWTDTILSRDFWIKTEDNWKGAQAYARVCAFMQRSHCAVCTVRAWGCQCALRETVCPTVGIWRWAWLVPWVTAGGYRLSMKLMGKTWNNSLWFLLDPFYKKKICLFVLLSVITFFPFPVLTQYHQVLTSTALLLLY